MAWFHTMLLYENYSISIRVQKLIMLKLSKVDLLYLYISIDRYYRLIFVTIAGRNNKENEL